jgi:hypothetical protein
MSHQQLRRQNQLGTSLRLSVIGMLLAAVSFVFGPTPPSGFRSLHRGCSLFSFRQT